MATNAVADIYSPDVYVDGPPHELFTQLRRTDPVFWQDMTSEPGYWAVLRHADVVHVAREPRLFSANEGGVVLEDLAAEQLAMMRDMLLAMDPPRHSDYRRPLAASFKRKVIGQLEPQIRAICREIMQTAAERGDVEFVHDVTAGLPSRVIGELMGLPRDDWEVVNRLAERNTSGQDPDLNHEEGATGDVDDPGNASIEMAMYAIGFAMRRRQEEPRDDLTTLILESDFGGKHMTDIDFGSFFVQLVTAGNDTTKTMLSSGLLALLQHPAQLAELRADPSLTGGAVEEILRWANPLHYFRRTATADTELHGVPIAAGDQVAMYYTSANRDDDVFDDSQCFDIHRNPNPHLSFGIAEHFCLGVHLARLEGRVFFEELLSTFPTIQLTGEPKRTRSNLNNALKSLPVRLHRRGGQSFSSMRIS
jgi:cytochrome P450